MPCRSLFPSAHCSRYKKSQGPSPPRAALTLRLHLVHPVRVKLWARCLEFDIRVECCCGSCSPCWHTPPVSWKVFHSHRQGLLLLRGQVLTQQQPAQRQLLRCQSLCQQPTAQQLLQQQHARFLAPVLKVTRTHALSRQRSY